MRRLIRKRSEKAGLPPGTLVYVGEKKVENVKITIIDYDETQITEKEAAAIEECFPFKDKPTVTWINIDGLHEVDIIEKLGNHFGLHPLLLEDILNTEQRPKMEESENYIFFVLKMIFSVDEDKEIKAEQVSLILGHNFVISFQEREGDVFNPVRDRIRKSKGRIRKVGADYLAYALLDAIVDSYFSVLENVGEKIEDTEQQLTLNPTTQTLQLIRKLKNEMIFLRKSVWPLRELISGFLRLETSLVQQSTVVYIRDVYDHTIQVIDTIESYRDMISGMLDIYLSSISNRLNEIMKVLTIIATIFMPLTFLAGVYGMNFKHMPELEWTWGYPASLGLMLGISLTMLFFFRRKRWI